MSRPAASRRKGRVISVSEVSREDTRDHLSALFGLVISGHQSAFAEFYGSTASRVHRVVQRCLIDYAQTEEVTQEVYLEIWQNARSFDRSKGDVLAWVFTIAHRRAIDRVRASQAAHSRDVKIGIRDRQVEFDSVSESVGVRIEHGRAKEAMGILPALQRDAIELVYFDGLTHNEVAERLGVPLTTVKSRMTSGLIRMRQHLSEAA